jgi:membrane-associated PAP2 superfamily phosphatase
MGAIDLGRRVVVACVLLPSLAQAQTRDTSSSKTFFTGHDALLGAGLVVASAGLSVFDVRIARYFQDTALTHVRAGRVLDGTFTHINETTLTVGGLAVYAVGRIFKMPTVADVSLHVAESVAAASLTAQVIRGPLGRTRPQNTTPQFSDQYDFHFMQGFSHFENRAFPSIHSSSGFAAASAITAEVHERDPSATWFVGVPAYILAMTPGLSRMYLGQHWASDILSGALLGTFYGWRVVQYSHAHERTPLDRLFLGPADHARVGASGGRLEIGWSTTF